MLKLVWEASIAWDYTVDFKNNMNQSCRFLTHSCHKSVIYNVVHSFK